MGMGVIYIMEARCCDIGFTGLMRIGRHVRPNKFLDALSVQSCLALNISSEDGLYKLTQIKRHLRILYEVQDMPYSASASQQRPGTSARL